MTLEKQLKEAKRVCRLYDQRCALLDQLHKEQMEKLIEAGGVVAGIEHAIRTKQLEEEDAVEKNGPVVQLSTGKYCIVYFASTEPWPNCGHINVHVNLRLVGQEMRHANMDIRPGGVQYGDEFPDDDVEIVLDALLRVDTSNPLSYPDPDAAKKIRPYIATWPKSWKKEGAS